MRLLWFLCLTIAAISDIKGRTVSCRILLICGVFGIFYGWKTGMAAHAAGLLIGVGLLAVSKITEGAVGNGDGWFFMVSAWYLEAEEAWILLTVSLMVSWFWGAGLILYRAFRRENMGKDTLPFLACMWPAGMWILLRKEGIMWLSTVGKDMFFLPV